MPGAPIPEGEAARLEAVRACGIDRAAREAWTDELASMAATLAGTPIALISVVDSDRQWFAGSVGLDAAGTPRDQAFCAYTILADAPLVVEDATKDPRFRDSPLVTGEMGLRFYAGVPITEVGGERIGTVCVLGLEPGTISEQQIEALRGLARLVSLHLSSSRRHEAILGASLDAIISIDSSSTVIEFSQAAEEMYGYTREEAMGSSLAALIIPPAYREAHKAGMARYNETGEGPVLGTRIEITSIRKSGEEFPVELAISPATIDGEPCFTAFIRDLTDQKQLHKALEFTRFTVDQTADSIFWISREAKVIDCNPAAPKRLGYTRDELLSKTVFDIDTELPEGAWDAHWEELASAGSLLLDSYHQRKDGRTFPVEVSCNHVVHDGVEYNCVIVRDVSDRRRAELALHASEERFRDIATAAGEYIWETDTEGRYTFVTEPVEDLLGRGREELIGHQPFAFMPRDEAVRVQEVFERAREARQPFRAIEHRSLHSSGAERWQSLSGKAVYDTEGRFCGYRGLGLDVTELKVASVLRRRRTELLRIAREAMGRLLEPDQLESALAHFLSEVGVFAGASRGYVAGVESGSACTVMSHWLPDTDGPGADWSRIESVAPGAVGLMSRHDAVLSASDASGPFGGLFGASGHLGMPVNADGELALYIGFDWDDEGSPMAADEAEILLSVAAGLGHAIERSRRKRELVDASQDLERALERAEAANDAKTAFLAHISHEIRTPLTAVLGFSTMIRDEQDESVRLQLLDKIDRNGESLLKIINEILDLSTIEAGTVTTRRETVSVMRVLTAAADAITTAATGRGLSLLVDIGRDVPAMIESDQVRLVQVLTNLLTNAVRYTDAGRVRLSVSVPGDGPDLSVRFAVSDTGRGIAEDDQKRVFSAFDRGSIETSEDGGAGLGLAISAKLVHLLGGSMSLDSTLGVGSTFTVDLPAAGASGGTLPTGPVDDRAMSDARPRAVRSGVQLDGLTVLLVEDSEHVREVVTYFLRERGATVCPAEHGGLAVEFLESGQTPVDLVLMDMQMPVLDGYGATRRLRELGYTLPIIALTAHGMKHERERCLTAGCDDYLSKPVEPALLADTCLRYWRDGEERADGVPAPEPVRAAASAPVTPAAPAAAAPVVERAPEPSVAPVAEVAQEAALSPMEALRQKFREHLRDELAELEQSRAMADLEATRRRAHKMAGAAGNLGLPQVTEVARTLCAVISQEEDVSTIESALRDLRETIESALSS